MLVSGCTQHSLSNKEKIDIYTQHLIECLDSQEYEDWENDCQNNTNNEEYYLKNCFGYNYCEEKLKPLAQKLQEI